MSSSSKYANLPFIASGEKDIYETDDLPESDQTAISKPINDVSIEIIPSGTSDAFQKFALSESQHITSNGVIFFIIFFFYLY